MRIQQDDGEEDMYEQTSLYSSRVESPEGARMAGR